MKRNIFIIFGLLSFLAYSPLLAQQVESNSSEAGSDSADAFAIIPNLEPEEVKDIEQNRSKVIFKTSVKNCRIYLNQNFQGISKLTLINLVDGFYLLRAEKDGYKYQENFVYIEHGKEKTFYIELEANEETQKKLEARANAQEAARNQAASKEKGLAEEADSPAEAEPAVQANDSFGDAK